MLWCVLFLATRVTSNVTKSMLTAAILGMGALTGKRPSSMFADISRWTVGERMVEDGARGVTMAFKGLRWRDITWYGWVDG